MNAPAIGICAYLAIGALIVWVGLFDRESEDAAEFRMLSELMALRFGVPAAAMVCTMFVIAICTLWAPLTAAAVANRIVSRKKV